MLFAACFWGIYEAFWDDGHRALRCPQQSSGMGLQDESQICNPEIDSWECPEGIS